MHAVATTRIARRILPSAAAAAAAASSTRSIPRFAPALTPPPPAAAFSSSATMSAANGHAAIPKIPIPDDYNKVLYTPLAEADPEVYKIIQDETWRQFSGLELIASENLTSLATMEANGSILTNKYSEGLPNARYYGGNEHIDKLEILTQQRALHAFNLDPKIWGVNVQPYAGSTANFAVFTAFLQPFERIMGLKLSDGGHLTHGAYTPKKNISASSIYFQAFPYKVDPKTGLLDYDKLAENADLYRPKLIISGGSAYPRDWDYKRLSEIAKANNSLLMCDMAHISGLVAAQVNANPFEYCDVVTTTTHKTLRGPRAGLIFFRKDKDPEAEAKVNAAVFPACQGGPHNNTIAGIAVALKQAADPAFRAYALQIQANAREIAKVLLSHEYKIQTDGTDNHIVLWDLRPLGLTGSKIEKLADRVHITLNKNAVAGDVSAVTPGGVRIGTNALTSRSMKEPEMVQVAEFLHRLVQIALLIQKACGSKKLVDFEREADKEGGEGNTLLKQLHADVEKFATSWPLPGVPDTSVIQRAE